MDLVWLLRARQERRSQISYIASRNPAAALDIGLMLYNAVERLTQFPDSGRPGRAPNTRELVIAHTQLIAVYRIDRKADEIQILRILHAKQKYPLE
jgi:toxin ParE1/3/4